MLVTVTKEAIVHALNNDAVKHCGEIIEINQCGVDFYSDSLRTICNNRMVKYIIHGITAYEIISRDDSFVKECLSFIRVSSLPYFKLYLPSWYSLPPSVFKEYIVEKMSTFADYVLPKQYSTDLFYEKGEIIVLKDTDQLLASSFFLPEELQGRPDFDTLFRVIVLQKSLPGGKIFAYIKDGQIIAYLSCYLFKENIYDIDHIYVLPDYRKQGIGLLLVEYYIKSTIATGEIPRYGNAENDNSRRLAKKAGFIEVKCQDKYVLKRVEPKNEF